MMMSGVEFPLTDRACSVKMEALSLLLQSSSSLKSGGFLWVDAMTLAAARRSPASTLQTRAAFISLFVRGSAGTTALT